MPPPEAIHLFLTSAHNESKSKLTQLGANGIERLARASLASKPGDVALGICHLENLLPDVRRTRDFSSHSAFSVLSIFCRCAALLRRDFARKKTPAALPHGERHFGPW
jgi:hypothetical protein